jgi:hypothetical protein
MRSDFTDEITETLDWTRPDDCQPKGTLLGKLVADHAVFAPNGINGCDMQLAIESVGAFAYGRGKAENEDVSGPLYLSFQIVTRSDDAAGLCWNYRRTVGDGVGMLRVRYAKQEQGDLGLSEEAHDDAPTKQKPETGGTLLSAAVAAGGRAALKKERKGRQKAKAAPGDGASCQIVKPEVEGEPEPIREHNWTLGKDRATVCIYENNGALRAFVSMDVKGVGELGWESTLEGPQSIPHLGVAVAGEIEQECRDRAKVNGITAETKHALAQLLSWSREVAGEYRIQGRTAAESKQAAAEARG